MLTRFSGATYMGDDSVTWNASYHRCAAVRSRSFHEIWWTANLLAVKKRE
ncbi:MAG: hypothetical protein SO182_01950 [Paludibacteraceae bacterium]|nr:hypothetical protein [Paludibacteraceae bacterium]